MLAAIKRRLWKSAVVNEFHRLHGINLRVIGQEMIGPGALDDLLNAQYEYAADSPTLGAQNISRVLYESFGIRVEVLALQARINAERESE